MSFKSLLIGAVFATALPIASSAAVLPMCDATGTQNIAAPNLTNNGNVYNCQFNLTAPANSSGTYQYNFLANPTPTAAMATNVQLSSGNSSLAGVTGTVQWWEADAFGALVSLISSTAMSIQSSFTFGADAMTNFADAGPDYQSLVIDWSGFSGPSLDVNVQVNQVPLPAGVLLMGTALAGFGVMRRRKKQAA